MTWPMCVFLSITVISIFGFLCYLVKKDFENDK